MSFPPGDAETAYRRFPCPTCCAPRGERCRDRGPETKLTSRSHLARRNEAALAGAWPAAVRTPPTPNAVLLEEVDHLAGYLSPLLIASKLGMTPGAIARAFTRAGRHADARPFYVAERQYRQGLDTSCYSSTT